MAQKQDYIDNLIGKYLAGEADAEEIAIVDQWTKESPDNRHYIDHLKTIFTNAASAKALQHFDTDAAWAKMKSALQSQKASTVTMPMVKSRNQGMVWRIAASIAFILGVGFFIYQFQRPEMIQPLLVSSRKEAVADTLPDGSKVFLNKSTSLTYAFNKEKKEHVVKLKGEAFFNIKHDEKKNFVIDIDGIYVRDIGTSFNVKAYPERNTIEVVVEEGEVKFYTDSDSGVYLKEKGKAVYDKRTKSFTLESPEENILAYKTKVFNFENMELGQVVSQLNEVYSKQIVIDKRLQHCHLTVSFNNESQEEIVGVITETLGLTINQSADKIVLEGQGCEPQ